ncbi:MAG: hypothetical protein KF859_07200 [Phycisphaeraceae bacterium]|nr:hypothetical protein [Phycisphaeraceae bacterium]
MKTRTIRRATGVGVLLAVSGLAASATGTDNFVWIAPGGGLWSVNGNWSPMGFPNTPTDTASIGGVSPFSVGISGSVTCGQVILTNPQATIAIGAGSFLSLHSAAQIMGTLLVNSSAAAVSTDLSFHQPVSISGGGLVRLNAATTNVATARLVAANAGASLSLEPGTTISGRGQIGTPFVNRGMVDADVDGRAIEVVSHPIVNQNLLRASDGGILTLTTNVTQSPGASINADGGTVRLSTVTINGTLNALNGGSFVLIGNPTLVQPTINADIGVQNAQVLTLQGGSATVNGTITVNTSAGGSTTQLRFGGDLEPQGGGVFALNASSSNVATADLTGLSASDTFTLPATHTIRGSGRLLSLLVNNSTVSADISGRVLQLGTNPKVNNGVMRGTNGGVLEVLTNITQSPGASINADGGTVRLSTVTINGTLNALNGGSFVLIGNPTLVQPTINADIGIQNAQVLTLQGGSATVNGTITVNTSAGGSTTQLRFGGDLEPQGGGVFALNASSSNVATADLTGLSASDTFTLPATHTIRGSGRLLSLLVNNSTVSADISGRVLQLGTNPKVNNGVMRGTNGGVLEVLTNITQSPGASINADGGTVRLSTVTINGTLNALNGGSFVLIGNPTLVQPTINADIGIQNAQVLTLQGGSATVNGTITVNTSAGGSTTQLRFGGDLEPQGGGVFALNASSSNVATADLTGLSASDTFTLPATHTIRGSGRLLSLLVNNSTVSADISGRVLQLGTNPKVNNGVMRGTNGGVLEVLTNITQSPGASINADGGTVRLSTVTINGTLNALNGGSFVLIGNPTLVQPTINADIGIQNAQVLTLQGGSATVNGTITVNTSAGGSTTQLRIAGNTVITGSGAGVTLLNALPSNFATALISGAAPQHILTIGEGHVVAGRGRVTTPTLNSGTIAPGAHPTGVDRLEWHAPLTMQEDGAITIELAGTAAAQHDRLTSTHAITLDGTLDVSYIGSYAPTRGDVYTVIQAPSITGEFINVNTPPLSSGVGLKVRYNATSVQLEAICYADINEDGGIDGADVEAFFAFWESGDPIADLNNDGGIDGADVEFFFAVWEEGGC